MMSQALAATAVATMLTAAVLLPAAHAQAPSTARTTTTTALPPSTQAAAQAAAQSPADMTPAVRDRITRAKQRIAQRRLGNEVGVTGVSNLPLAQVTGFRPEPVSREAMRAHNKQALAALAAYKREEATRPPTPSSTPMPILIKPAQAGACNTAARRFDWRVHGAVSPVVSQGRCGSCWAFASVHAAESSLRRQFGRENNISEQYVMNNASSKPNACDGGSPPRALDFLTKVGSTDDRVTPYKAAMGPRRAADDISPYGLVGWGWVEPASAFDGTQLVKPSRATFKQALCEHGPLIAGISADDDFKDHTNGLLEDGFLEMRTAGLNHVVLIVGWDDANDSWIIKNSWGTDWGETAGFGNERGYAYVKHGSYLLGNQAWWVHGRLPRDKPSDLTRSYESAQTAAPLGSKALAALTPPTIVYPSPTTVKVGHGQRVLFSARAPFASQHGKQYEVQLRADSKQGSAPYGVHDRGPADLLTRLESGGSDGLEAHVPLPTLKQHGNKWHWRVRVLLNGGKEPGRWSDWSHFDLARAQPYVGPEESDVPRMKRPTAPTWSTTTVGPTTNVEALQPNAPTRAAPKW